MDHGTGAGPDGPHSHSQHRNSLSGSTGGWSVSSQTGLPSHRTLGTGANGGEAEEEESFVDKISNWWRQVMNDGPAPPSPGGGSTGTPTMIRRDGEPSSVPTTTIPNGSSVATALLVSPFSAKPIPPPPPSSSLDHQQQEHQVAVATPIIEDDEPAAPPGCGVGLFTAAQAVVASRRFLKLNKPKAGSSFHRLSIDNQFSSALSGTHQLHESQSQREDGSMVVGGDGVVAMSSPTSPHPPPPAACAWEEAIATSFLVRSYDYMRSKQKVPAGGCIYKLIGVDMYSFDSKLYHIAQHVELPPPPTPGPSALALPPSQRFPPLLIINLQLPLYAPSIFGGNNGEGHSLVYYFALPEGWQPEDVNNPAALGLAQRFFGNGVEFDGQPTRDRLKLLPRIVNVDEWAVEGPLSGAEVRLLRSYNGKPLLTRPQQRFYADPNGTYLEIDLDVHSYAYIARRAFYGYLGRLAPVVFENAFVLQGNRPEELPEVILGAARVHRVDFTKARPFPAQSIEQLGNGTEPRCEEAPPPSPVKRGE